MDIRAQFKAVYRLLMAAVTLLFLVAAFAAFYHSTPANGMLMISLVLFVIAILTGLSIDRHDRVDERLADAMEEMNAFRAANPVQAVLGDSFLKGIRKVEFAAAEPEVHSVSMEKLEFARQLAAKGAPIDEISLLIDPSFESRDPLYQQAVRKTVEAMLAARPGETPGQG